MKKKRIKRHRPSCREHSCSEPRREKYCKIHQEAKDRHHDKKQ